MPLPFEIGNSHRISTSFSNLHILNVKRSIQANRSSYVIEITGRPPISLLIRVFVYAVKKQGEGKQYRSQILSFTGGWLKLLLHRVSVCDCINQLILHTIFVASPLPSCWPLTKIDTDFVFFVTIKTRHN